MILQTRCMLDKRAANICVSCMAQDVGDADEGHLRKVFNALDLNGDGEITIDELQQVIETLPTMAFRPGSKVEILVDFVVPLLQRDESEKWPKCPFHHRSCS